MLISKINISFRVLGFSLLLDQCPIYPHWNGPTTTATPKKKKIVFKQNNSSALASRLVRSMFVCLFVCFFWRQLRDLNVKLPNATLYGGRGREDKTANIPFFFWTWINSLRIHCGKNGLHSTNWAGPNRALKGRKIHFFSDVFTAHDGGSSSLLKLANVGHDCIALVKGDTKDCHVFTRV